MPKLDYYDDSIDFLNTSLNSMSDDEHFKLEKNLKKRLSKVATRTSCYNFEPDEFYDDNEKIVSSSFSSSSSFNSLCEFDKIKPIHQKHLKKTILTKFTLN